MQYAAAHVMMDVDHCEYAHARSLLLQAWDEDIKHDEHMLQRPLNEYEQCLLAEQRAYAYMRHHPLSTIKTSLIEMVKTCVGLYVAQPLLTDALQWPDYTRSTTLWTKVKRFLMPSVRHKALIVFVYAELIQHVVLFFGILLFLLSLLWHAPWRKAFLLASGYIITFIVITLAYGCARLRMPIEPLLVIFAGAGWIWLYGRLYGVKKSI